MVELLIILSYVAGCIVCFYYTKAKIRELLEEIGIKCKFNIFDYILIGFIAIFSWFSLLVIFVNTRFIRWVWRN